jgi:hypothetical protein
MMPESQPTRGKAAHADFSEITPAKASKMGVVSKNWFALTAKKR